LIAQGASGAPKYSGNRRAGAQHRGSADGRTAALSNPPDLVKASKSKRKSKLPRWRATQNKIANSYVIEIAI
jgi:hypothetical protein